MLRQTTLALMALLLLSSCTTKQGGETAKPAAESTPAAAEPPKTPAEPAAATQAPAEPAAGPRVLIHLKDGSKVPGVIVASSQTHMVVAGDDGIERKIPLEQLKSVQYGDAQPVQPIREAAREPAPVKSTPPPAAQQPPEQIVQKPIEPPPAAAPAPPPPAPTRRVYVVPSGSEVSVRVNETIDSKTAAEGQSFDAEVTRAVQDDNGELVIPRGTKARVVIKSASKGGHFRGASDLVLDLESITLHGKQYRVDTAEITQKGKEGIGANKRTAEYTGGGAALGAIIGAIAGGKKGAAIGAGAGAGGGVLTQVLTKGDSIRVPVETVLTFRLDRPLRVTVAE